MGFFDKLGEQLGNAVKEQMDSYNKVSSNDRTSHMSDEQLREKARRAIERKDYGAAKAYGDEYKSRRGE